VRISENDVDWYADLIRHMQKNGLAAVEPTREAEDRWMEHVYQLGQRSLLTKAQTWYVGANVSGKPKGLSLYTGGFQKYREHCTLAAQDGYRNFSFAHAKETATA
jgi:hypothetical protein